MGLMGLMGSQARAQFGAYGVKGSVGMATIADDLSTNSPIVGAGVGGYVNYTFAESQSVLAEIFYLQSGLNINRRGHNFEAVLDRDNHLSIRQGFYHAYYAQIPILACVHMELPIRKAGHVVGVYAGPAVSIGLFGRCRDRMVTPGVSSYKVNYDVDMHGSSADRAVFNHLQRLDVSAIVGLSYEYRNFVFSLYVDHGFLATSKEEDILRVIENNLSGTNNITTKIPNGNNNAVMVSVGYNLGSF